jgi:hypothetical protein
MRVRVRMRIRMSTVLIKFELIKRFEMGSTGCSESAEGTQL